MLLLLRDQGFPVWEVSCLSNGPDSAAFLNDLHCILPGIPFPQMLLVSVLSSQELWLIILSGEAAFLNKMSSHTSSIESLWERKHVVIPSAHLAHTHAFLMKRCIVSVSLLYFPIGGRGTKRKCCWPKKMKGATGTGDKRDHCDLEGSANLSTGRCHLWQGWRRIQTCWSSLRLSVVQFPLLLKAHTSIRNRAEISWAIYRTLYL